MGNWTVKESVTWLYLNIYIHKNCNCQIESAIYLVCNMWAYR